MNTEICSACHGIGGYTSQSNPARIIDRCGACGGAGEVEVPGEQIVSPDCRDENCHKCDGRAFDDAADEITDCEHECHEEER